MVCQVDEAEGGSGSEAHGGGGGVPADGRTRLQWSRVGRRSAGDLRQGRRRH
jgi:hypothetical protein